MELSGDEEKTPSSLRELQELTEARFREENEKFQGQLSTLSDGEKVPRPKILSQLRKLELKLRALQNCQQALEDLILNDEIESLIREYEISQDEAITLITTRAQLATRLVQNGAIYAERPFNFAIVNTSLSGELSLRLKNLSLILCQTLAIVDKLTQEAPRAKSLLSKGTTEIERKFMEVPIVYPPADFIRTDIAIVNGKPKIIELNPTWVDYIAALEAFQITYEKENQISPSQALNEVLLTTYRSVDKSPKSKPNLLILTTPQTGEVWEEMTTLTKKLQTTDDYQGVFLADVSRLEYDKQNQKLIAYSEDGWDSFSADLVYANWMPSMTEDDPFAYDGVRALLKAYQNGLVVLPAPREFLDKKVAMALIVDPKYRDYFISQLGFQQYQELTKTITPTYIVDPNDQTIPRLFGRENWEELINQEDKPGKIRAVLKPSGGRSTRGVLIENVPEQKIEWKYALRSALDNFENPEEPLYVLQPFLELPEMGIWGYDAKSRLLKYLPDARVKLNVWTIGQKYIGTLATASDRLLINDAGFNFPV